ncbi:MULTISPECIES: cache domain-containing sensor histidine kinase [Paenibacillus]|uniref:Two-component system sensor histidine kinase YesM n=1 Tax=Paenibacillus pabuli TaxID=1472 RepID=A0A855YJ23_9BACL|nr:MULTISPECIES: histidine kinase [Paenibacillus]PWW44934.1 two-component system sensor histidine kinase YesM [Paenibacillus pabuli]PXW11270.1 two-component system sensor histidine kinase YesM [Paenibacillus taichungensis]
MRWIQLCKRFKFRTKLILFLSAATVLISGITGLITYRIHISLFNEEVSRQYSLTAEQVLARLDSRVHDMYKVTDYITLNPSVKNAIKAQAAGISSYDQMKLEEELDDQLYQVRLDAPEIMGIRIYDLKGNIFNLGTFAGSFQQMDPSYLAEMVHKLEGTGGEYVWNRLEADAFLQEEKSNWILAGRLMRSVDLETYGVMLILFNTSLFESYLKDLRLNEDIAAYLLDADGKLVYAFHNQDADPPPLTQLSMGATEIRDEQGTAHLYTKQTSDKAKFTLISKVSLAQIQQKGKIIVKVAVFSAAATVLCSWIIITIISRRLLRPLASLVNGMKRVRDGQFDTRVQIQTQDELGFIGERFNAMASRIDTLIHEVYERELSEKQAELKAIQAQLNPHFLYNTLSMFFWKFYMLGDEKSARLVTALSEMLQYTLEPVQRLTTLQDEMNQIDHYLQIQQARYQEALSIEISVPSELLRCQVIRLLLQPIVENVFVHAFADKRDNRRLEIRVFRYAGNDAESDMLILEIADNGCGMDPSMMDRILSPLAHADEERQHIGMRSVIRRIELIHGDPYGVQIESTAEVGTLVKLRLPYQVE